jgi:metallo-beta-lactamase family protein
MQLQFLGAAQTVTGSMHLITLENGTKILLDCGLFQGKRDEANLINQNFPFDAKEIDCVLLSHAHIDHAGRLPQLFKAGFSGRIFSTHATYSLSSLMLMDSAHIQEMDVQYVNKKHAKLGKAPVQALYTQKDAEEVLKRFVAVGYRQAFQPIHGVSVEYRDTGHILGSASMVISVSENGKTTKIGFTGDVGRPNRLILKDPEGMEDCDYLITESTYGGQTHLPTSESADFLANVIQKTAQRGGKIIIPAFSVGRTQELVYTLDKLQKEGRLGRIPVFVDSPLAVNATDVYRSHPECYDDDMKLFLRQDEDPFGFDKLTYVRSLEASKALNARKEPMVIISASGMCEAGRILHHLRNNIENPKNTILMIGYNAQNTLGRRIADKNEIVKIFGEEHHLRAEVVQAGSYSAHADEPELLDFIGQMDKERLKSVFLVHGELERQKLLQSAMQQAGYANVEIPEKGRVFQV